MWIETGWGYSDSSRTGLNSFASNGECGLKPEGCEGVIVHT